MVYKWNLSREQWSCRKWARNQRCCFRRRNFAMSRNPMSRRLQVSLCNRQLKKWLNNMSVIICRKIIIAFLFHQCCPSNNLHQLRSSSQFLEVGSGLSFPPTDFDVWLPVDGLIAQVWRKANMSLAFINNSTVCFLLPHSPLFAY